MIHGLLTSELFWTGLVWLLALGMLGVIVSGLWREHRHFRSLLSDPRQELRQAFALLYRRQLQLWAVVGLLVVVLGANDLRHAFQEIPSGIFTNTAVIVPTPAVTPKTSQAPTSPIIASSPVPFSDIIEFNEKDSREQAYIDLLKQRYEAWLVTYYYLQKCGKVTTDDLGFIRNALTKELSSVNAQADTAANILTAASGSYEEMYRDIPCDKEYLITSKASYDANMQQIRKLLGTSDAQPPQPSGLKTAPKR